LEADAETEGAGPKTSVLGIHRPSLHRRERILKKKAATFETWARGHRFGRTTVFDWKAGRGVGKSSKGKVSVEKSAEIEAAIEADARELGLTPRTDSD
jgi:hypothetical protein